MSSKIVKRMLIGALGAITIAALVYVFHPTNWQYYTDGMSIRQSARDAEIRLVLWEDPEPLSYAMNSVTNNIEPVISQDGRMMVFARGRAKQNANLFMAFWDGSAWGDAAPLEQVNSESDELGPEFSSDGRLLYFYSDRVDGLGGYDIWVSPWSGSYWGAPTNLGPQVNSPYNEYDPAVVPGGDRLFFSSNRPLESDIPDPQSVWQGTLRELVTTKDYDIFQSSVAMQTTTNTLPDGEVIAVEDWNPSASAGDVPVFTNTIRVVAINTEADEGQVDFTPRGDFIYFSSNRGGGEGGFDIYRCRLFEGRYLEPEGVGIPVNGPRDDMDPALWMEGHSLVFSSNRSSDTGQEFTLYQSTSREVLARLENVRLALLWEWLKTNWWMLLLLLLGLLGLLFLIRFFLNEKVRREMSLLTQCIVASVLLHLLLAFFLSLWYMTSMIVESTQGPMQVAVSDSALARERLNLELREEVTQLNMVRPDLPRQQQIEPMAIPESSPANQVTEQPVDTPVTHDFVVEFKPLEQIDIDTPEPKPIVPELSFDLPELETASAPEMLETPETSEVDPQEVAPQHAQEIANQKVELDTPDVQEDPEHRSVEPIFAEVKPLVEQRFDPAPALNTADIPQLPTLDFSTEIPVLETEIQETLMERPDVAPIAESAIARVRADSKKLPSEQERLEVPELTEVKRIVELAPPPGVITNAVKLDVSRVAASVVTVTNQLPERIAHAEVNRLALDIPNEALETRTLEVRQDEAFVMHKVADTSSEQLVPERIPESEAVASRPEIIDLKLDTKEASQEVELGQVARANLTTAPLLTQPEAVALMDIQLPIEMQLEIGAPLPSEQPAREAVSLPAPAPLADQARLPSEEVMETPVHMPIEHIAAQVPDQPRTASAVTFLPAEEEVALLAFSGDELEVHSELPEMSLGAVVALESKPMPEMTYALREPALRERMIEELGGNDETEAAISRALQFLARAQERDGSWSMKTWHGEQGHDVAATALAMLCFMGHGATHRNDHLYRDQVGRSVKWLADQVDDKGRFNAKDMYDQGMATIALAEVYALTRDPDIRAPLERAVDYILRAQHGTTGGWRYQPGDPGDTSVFGWQVMALRSARLGGLEIPDEAMQRSDKWLDKVGGGRNGGHYGYENRNPNPAMVAEGMFCRQLLGHPPTDKRMMESAKYVGANLPTVRKKDYYYWYYGCLALYQHKGPHWEEWNERMREILVNSQERNGKHAGSWNPQGDHHGSRMGRVVSTALSTLSLEVYYRYLPMYGASVK